MSDFVLSVSYGNYLIQNGGTDKVIREHQEMFSDQKVDYVFLFPVVRTVRIGKIKKEFRYWGINNNKRFIGLFKINGALTYIHDYIGKKNRCLGAFVHHTWRVDINELKTILDYIDVPLYFYLHDFHSICGGKNLIRQDGEYCGYGLNNLECNPKCTYYEQSIFNRAILSGLIERYGNRLQFIAPSDNTRNIYRRTFSEHQDLFISIPHQKPSGEYKKETISHPLKIAFIGKQVHLKGWDDFKEIVQRFGASPDYEFYYLGTGTDQLANVKATVVSVREQGPDAMLNTLRKLKIDVVLLLSRCPETYSYTYFEAYAAGCYVITYKCSGNMADMVKKNGNGIIYDNVKGVSEDLVNSKDLSDKVFNENRKHSLIPNRMIPNEEIVTWILDKAHKEIGVCRPDSGGKKQIFMSLLYKALCRSKSHDSKKHL
jgi:glycosyltransferase involved in cell wall biosynthesis